MGRVDLGEEEEGIEGNDDGVGGDGGGGGGGGGPRFVMGGGGLMERQFVLNLIYTARKNYLEVLHPAI